MKKKILLSLCCICLIVITGCGDKKDKKAQQDTSKNTIQSTSQDTNNKKLTCTSNFQGIEMKITFSFDDNDNVESAIMEASQELDDSIDDDELNKEIENTKESFKEEGFESADVKRDGNKLTIQAKMNGEDKLEDFFKWDLDNYDIAKASIEKEGGSCE